MIYESETECMSAMDKLKHIKNMVDVRSIHFTFQLVHVYIISLTITDFLSYSPEQDLVAGVFPETLNLTVGLNLTF